MHSHKQQSKAVHKIGEDKIIIKGNINNLYCITISAGNILLSSIITSNLLRVMSAAKPLRCFSETNAAVHVLIHYWRGKIWSSKEKCKALLSLGQKNALRDLWQHDAYFNRRNKKIKRNVILFTMNSMPLWRTCPYTPLQSRPWKPSSPHLESVNNFKWMKQGTAIKKEVF